MHMLREHPIFCVIALLGWCGIFAMVIIEQNRKPMDPEVMSRKVNECTINGLDTDLIYHGPPDEDVVKDIQCVPPGVPLG